MSRPMVRFWTCALCWGVVLLLAACGSSGSKKSSGSPDPQTGPLSVIDFSPAADDQDVAINAIISATFSAVPDPGTVNPLTFTLQDFDGLEIPGSFSFEDTTIIFTPDSYLNYETYYEVVLTNIEDEEGNVLEEEFSWGFRTSNIPDTTPPTVLGTSPAQGTFAAPLNSNVAVAFSEPVDPDSLNAQTFSLRDSLGNPVAGTVFRSEDGTSALFATDDYLLANSTYTATLSDGIKDLAGNHLVAPYVWSFSTGSAPDFVAPTVLQTSPIADSVGIDNNASLVVTFSEAINPISANTATFIVQDAAGNLVPGLVSCNGATVTFMPTAPFSFKNIHQVTLTNGIEDLAGNALTEYSWSFTTGWGIVSVTPSSFARKVPTNSVILVTGSEDLNPATVNSTTVVLTNLKGNRKGEKIAGTVSLQGATITFTPNKALTSNNAYQVTLSTGLQDLTGIQLAKAYTWSFRTSR